MRTRVDEELDEVLRPEVGHNCDTDRGSKLGGRSWKKFETVAEEQVIS